VSADVRGTLEHLGQEELSMLNSIVRAEVATKEVRSSVTSFTLNIRKQ
jgi:hypothetical protein